MIKLRRVPAVSGGANWSYETLDGRYRIERQDGVTMCEHPLCDTLHRRFWSGSDDDWHAVSYVAWHVWDTVRDDYAGHEEFDTKREAHQWLDSFLERQS
jgi:hypothetical protein